MSDGLPEQLPGGGKLGTLLSSKNIQFPRSRIALLMLANRSKSAASCNGLWPSISDKESARGAVVYGFGWYIFSVVVTAIIAVSSLVAGHEIAGYDGWSLVDAALLALIAWRLWKNSRAWAVTGLVYESINVLYKLNEHQARFGIMPILIYLAAISSVRGAFAFHKFSAQEQNEKLATSESNSGAAASSAKISTLPNFSDLKGIAMFVPDRLKANAFRILRLPSKASLAARGETGCFHATATIIRPGCMSYRLSEPSAQGRRRRPDADRGAGSRNSGEHC